METFYTNIIGKRFKINGRGPDEFDCYGLVKEIAKRRGYYLPQQDTPEGIKLRLAMFDKISSEFTEPIDTPEPWAIVVFDKGRLGRLHIGVVLENCEQFLHADRKGVRISRLSSPGFLRKIAGFYKLKQIKE